MLFDDAAMFPPGNASAEVALSEYLRHRKAWYADMIGPLLVPAGAWDAFVAAHECAGGPEVAVVVIGTTTMPPAVPAAVRVAGFEAAVPNLPLPQTDPGLTFAAEITPGSSGARVLAAVGAQAAAGRPVVAKLRTGGVTRDAFPSEETLAAVLAAAVAVQAPLKLTAGLHHALRHTAADTGFEHHGFLNVLLAAAHAIDGRDAGALAATLSMRDKGQVVAQLSELPGERIVAARRRFVSFGCCGVEEPVGDLVSLGLVA